MKTLISIISLITVMVLNPVVANGKLIPFDAYVERAGTKIVWMMEAGGIESKKAEIVITALDVGGYSRDLLSHRRGVRLELKDERTTHILFLEDHDIEPILLAVKNLYAEVIAGYPPALQPGEKSSCYGRGEFFYHRPPFHQFSVDYCSEPDWTGLSMTVWSTELHKYDFPGNSPDELAGILDQALKMLNQRHTSR